MAHVQPCMIQLHPPPPPPAAAPKRVCETSHPVNKTLATAANLANLLPTGTVFAFRTLTPSFSNKGSCQLSNVFLTASLMVVCAISCFLSSFTDSFVDCDGKVHFGTATFRGLRILNSESCNKAQRESPGDMDEYFSKFKIRAIDFLHAFVSVFVFLIFALGDSDVQSCFFAEAGENVRVLMMNLPLGAGVLSSFLFVLFPTTRKGIGYADLPRCSCQS